jgi:hypothetical protein
MIPTQTDITDALRMPSDFGYSGHLPIGETWSLGPMILNRDSGPLEQANSQSVREAFTAAFGDEGEENGWVVTRCNHWAVGWVDHLSFKAIDDNGSPSAQFVEMLRLNAEVEENTVLDEDLLCQLDHEAVIEYLEWNATRWLSECVPDDWPEVLAREVSAEVIHEGGGVYLPDNIIINALRKLEWLDEQED